MEHEGISNQELIHRLIQLAIKRTGKRGWCIMASQNPIGGFRFRRRRPDRRQRAAGPVAS